MIGKVQNNGVSFKGQLVVTPQLRDAFNYAKECAYSENEKFGAAEFANTVNYILEKTPETDVFELKDDGYSHSVSLFRNGDRVGHFDNFDKRVSAFEAMKMFLISEKNTALEDKTPSMIERLDVLGEIHKLDEEYTKTKAALEEKSQDLYDRIGLEGLKKVREAEKKLGLNYEA